MENRKLKKENESFKSKQAEQEVEKLKLENLILKLENQNQRLLYKNELKVEKLKSEHQLSNQQPIEAKSNFPKLVTKMDRLIEGVSRFIVGIEPKMEEYDSYAQWYDDMLYRMEDGCVYHCQKYLFFCEKNLRSVHNLSYHSCAKGHRVGSKKRQNIYIKTLEQGWTQENTKLVCILHPENPQQFAELEEGYIGKDKDGKEMMHAWYLGDGENLDACCKNSEGGKPYSVIFCCIKK